MAIYGITERTKARFKAKFGAYFTLDPAGSEWTSLAEALYHVAYRIEFRRSFNWSHMVSILREMCEEAGLVREDRGVKPHILEGYYGLALKQKVED